MTTSRQRLYERLGAARTPFLDRCAKESRAFGLASELRGAVALSGSQSVRPAFLLPEVIVGNIWPATYYMHSSLGAYTKGLGASLMVTDILFLAGAIPDL